MPTGGLCCGAVRGYVQVNRMILGLREFCARTSNNFSVSRPKLKSNIGRLLAISLQIQWVGNESGRICCNSHILNV